MMLLTSIFTYRSARHVWIQIIMSLMPAFVGEQSMDTSQCPLLAFNCTTTCEGGTGATGVFYGCKTACACNGDMFALSAHLRV